MEHAGKEPRSDLIYGRHPVLEALRAQSRRIQKVLLSETSRGEPLHVILNLLRERRIRYDWVKPHELGRLVSGPHQGVVALVSPVEYVPLPVWLNQLRDKDNPWVCLLDGIQDPHNLGAIIRSAVCFGCHGVVIPEWRASPVNPTVVKSAAGATEHIPIVRVKNIGHAIKGLKDFGFHILGAHLEGEDARQVSTQGPRAIVVGGEGEGLRPVVRKACDRTVRIPQENLMSSLNASCSAAILFFLISTAATP